MHSRVRGAGGEQPQRKDNNERLGIVAPHCWRVRSPVEPETVQNKHDLFIQHKTAFQETEARSV